MGKCDGMLLTGGPSKLFRENGEATYYQKKIRFILDLVKEINQKRYFLTWATCLAHESLVNGIQLK